MILSLTEHETSCGVELDRDLRDWLRASDLKLTVEPTFGAVDRYDLTPGSTVGIVQRDGCTVVVHPKLPVDHVLWMLSYRVENAETFPEPVALEEHVSLVEALVITFNRHLHRALRRGPLSGYVRVEESLSTVRGRILFDIQVRSRFGTLLPIEVAHDEFTHDIEENRRIKAALAVLRSAPIRSAALRTLLRRWEVGLQDVTLVSYRVPDFPRICFNRLNEHYRSAITTANLILTHCSFESKAGRTSSFSLLFDMNKVAEDFLVRALRDALSMSERSLQQGGEARGLLLDDEGFVPLRPDFSLWEGGRCRLVGDVKYKLGVAYGSFSQADVYQMLAYCTGAGVPSGMIVMLGHLTTARELHVSIAGKRIAIRHVDITQPKQDLLRGVRAIADEIEQALEAQTMRV